MATPRRPQPKRAKPAKKTPSRTARPPRGTWRPVLALAWTGAVSASVLAERAPLWLALGLAVLSLATLAVYGMDKAAAQRKQWRTPEQTLHVLSLAGGWPGALLGQAVFRHKTSKPEFQWVFAATVLINVGVMGWMVMRL